MYKRIILLVLLVALLSTLIPAKVVLATPWYCPIYPNASGCWTRRYIARSKTCFTQYLCYVWTSYPSFQRLRVTLWVHDRVTPGRSYRFYGPNWWGGYTNLK